MPSKKPIKKKIVVKFQEFELKKNVSAIHISGRLSLLQRKMVNVLLHHAFNQLLSHQEHIISISELARRTGFDSNDLEFLKNVFRELARMTIEWDILNPEGSKQWGISTFLASARIQNGVCTYEYSKALAEKLYRPEVYAFINLNIQNSFRSGYALALYENCIRFKITGSTGFRPIETWKQLLGVEEGKMYDDFKYFKKFILTPAIAEVNEHADIIIQDVYEKVGRKIVALRFDILDKNNPSLLLPKSVNIPLEDIEIELREIGLSDTQIKDILVKYEIEELKEILAIVKEDHRKGKIKTSLAAYAFAAFRDDYRGRTPEPVTAQTMQRTNKPKGRKKKLVSPDLFETQEIASAPQNLSPEQLQAFFLGLSAEEQKALDQAVEASLALEHPMGYALWVKEKNGGCERFEDAPPLVRMMCIGYRHRLLQERHTF